MSLSPRHALSIWLRNASLYRRTWKITVLPNFFEPVFYLTAIGIGVGAYITEMGVSRTYSSLRRDFFASRPCMARASR